MRLPGSRPVADPFLGIGMAVRHSANSLEGLKGVVLEGRESLARTGAFLVSGEVRRREGG